MRVKNGIFGRFLAFFLILPQLKNFFSRNLSTHITLILEATFVSNWMFLGLLTAEVLFGEKQSPTQTDTQNQYLLPAQLACR